MHNAELTTTAQTIVLQDRKCMCPSLCVCTYVNTILFLPSRQYTRHVLRTFASTAALALGCGAPTGVRVQQATWAQTVRVSAAQWYIGTAYNEYYVRR